MQIRLFVVFPLTLLLGLLVVGCAKKAAAPESPPAGLDAPVDTLASVPPEGDRSDCNQVRGTEYRSEAERTWYLTNCPAPASPCAVNASVSNAAPTHNSNVTLSAALICRGARVPQAPMTAAWHYRAMTSSCSVASGGDGVARCQKNISTATSGYQVRIDACFDYQGANYCGQAAFTPQ